MVKELKTSFGDQVNLENTKKKSKLGANLPSDCDWFERLNAVLVGGKRLLPASGHNRHRASDGGTVDP